MSTRKKSPTPRLFQQSLNQIVTKPRHDKKKEGSHSQKSSSSSPTTVYSDVENDVIKNMAEAMASVHSRRSGIGRGRSKRQNQSGSDALPRKKESGGIKVKEKFDAAVKNLDDANSKEGHALKIDQTNFTDTCERTERKVKVGTKAKKTFAIEKRQELQNESNSQFDSAQPDETSMCCSESGRQPKNEANSPDCSDGCHDNEAVSPHAETSSQLPDLIKFQFLNGQAETSKASQQLQDSAEKINMLADKVKNIDVACGEDGFDKVSNDENDKSVNKTIKTNVTKNITLLTMEDRKSHSKLQKERFQGDGSTGKADFKDNSNETDSCKHVDKEDLSKISQEEKQSCSADRRKDDSQVVQERNNIQQSPMHLIVTETTFKKGEKEKISRKETKDARDRHSALRRNEDYAEKSRFSNSFQKHSLEINERGKYNDKYSEAPRSKYKEKYFNDKKDYWEEKGENQRRRVHDQRRFQNFEHSRRESYHSERKPLGNKQPQSLLQLTFVNTAMPCKDSLPARAHVEQDINTHRFNMQASLRPNKMSPANQTDSTVLPSQLKNFVPSLEFENSQHNTSLAKIIPLESAGKDSKKVQNDEKLGLAFPKSRDHEHSMILQVEESKGIATLSKSKDVPTDWNDFTADSVKQAINALFESCKLQDNEDSFICSTDELTKPNKESGTENKHIVDEEQVKNLDIVDFPLKDYKNSSQNLKDYGQDPLSESSILVKRIDDQIVVVDADQEVLLCEDVLSSQHRQENEEEIDTNESAIISATLGVDGLILQDVNYTKTYQNKDLSAADKVYCNHDINSFACVAEPAVNCQRQEESNPASDFPSKTSSDVFNCSTYSDLSSEDKIHWIPDDLHSQADSSDVAEQQASSLLGDISEDNLFGGHLDASTMNKAAHFDDPKRKDYFNEPQPLPYFHPRYLRINGQEIGTKHCLDKITHFVQYSLREVEDFSKHLDYFSPMDVVINISIPGASLPMPFSSPRLGWPRSEFPAPYHAFPPPPPPSQQRPSASSSHEYPSRPMLDHPFPPYPPEWLDWYAPHHLGTSMDGGGRAQGHHLPLSPSWYSPHMYPPPPIGVDVHSWLHRGSGDHPTPPHYPWMYPYWSPECEKQFVERRISEAEDNFHSMANTSDESDTRSDAGSMKAREQLYRVLASKANSDKEAENQSFENASTSCAVGKRTRDSEERAPTENSGDISSSSPALPPSKHSKTVTDRTIEKLKQNSVSGILSRLTSPNAKFDHQWHTPSQGILKNKESQCPRGPDKWSKIYIQPKQEHEKSAKEKDNSFNNLSTSEKESNSRKDSGNRFLSSPQIPKDNRNAVDNSYTFTAQQEEKHQKQTTSQEPTAGSTIGKTEVPRSYAQAAMKRKSMLGTGFSASPHQSENRFQVLKRRSTPANLPSMCRQNQQEDEASKLRPSSLTYYQQESSEVQTDANREASRPFLDNNWRLACKPAVSNFEILKRWKESFLERSNRYSHKFIDSHCHIDFLYKRLSMDINLTYKEFREKFQDSYPVNYEGCVAVFCSPRSFIHSSRDEPILRNACEEEGVWLALGCHPKHATDFTEFHLEALRSRLNHPKVVALGEIGLDYSGTFYQHKDVQMSVFKAQLKLALELKLPLVIHCRDADQDCLEILKEIVPKHHKIHAHCFTRDINMARVWMDAFPNLFLGLTPVISYYNARDAINTATHIPLDRLLLETDSPYFVPRGVPKEAMDFSHPGLALYTAETVAQLQGVPVDVVLKACRDNTRKMYGI